jgi:excisionase family DNA binding protein
MSDESGVNSSEQEGSNRFRFITLKELAKQLRVTSDTITRWRNEGLIKAICVGGRVYFHLPTVEKELLENSKNWTRRGRRPRNAAIEQPTQS